MSIDTMDPAPTNVAVKKPLRKKRSRRSAWLRLLIHSHWMSSAISLVGMILFAFTGITLNHASQIETEPVIENQLVELPTRLQPQLRVAEDTQLAVLPSEVASWLSDQFAISIGVREAEWSADEVYLSLQGPGSDAWIAIDRESGEVEFQSTSRGWIAYLNDLHKGRHTGTAWMWFLDVFAVATLVFCITGLLLLYERAGNRRSTWPLVAIGLVAPWILILLFIH
ncbi:PepSY-associated TM helix domain protein [Rhodopirellula maiorica SM1]|uniref:PepSY-associated TM helix domain protein n=1 Tax=Rhodopirellula maiorica SM1 TaxID=1265738 RepID=M5R7V9_9BACT|nr:PepSY-associated TM helix domain-containing protein [Rhodopirellula maiorica]EMI15470.1 PepSY-associated TM helix domain protein [Rhodopirellula maiorica SM1]